MMMRKSGSGRKNGGEVKQRIKKCSYVNTKTNKRMRKKEPSETGYTKCRTTSTSSITSISSTANTTCIVAAAAAASSDVSGLTSSFSGSNSKIRSLAGNRSNTCSSSLNGISKTANKIDKSKSKDISSNRQSTVTGKPLKDLGSKVKPEFTSNEDSFGTFNTYSLNCASGLDKHNDDQHHPKHETNFISEKSLRSRTIISTNVPNVGFFSAGSVTQTSSPSSFSFSTSSSSSSKLNSSPSANKTSGDPRSSKTMSTTVLPFSSSSNKRNHHGRLSSTSSSSKILAPNASVFSTTDNHGISTCQTNSSQSDSKKILANGSSHPSISSSNLALSSSSYKLSFSPEIEPASNQPLTSSTSKSTTSQNSSKKSSNVINRKNSVKSNTTTSSSITPSKSTVTSKSLSNSKSDDKPSSKPNISATKKTNKAKKIVNNSNHQRKTKSISVKKASPSTPKQSTKKTDQRKAKKVKCNARVKKEPITRKKLTNEDDSKSSSQFRQRGQRMASLNAICKVHLLFESERDVSVTLPNPVASSPTPPPTPSPPPVETKTLEDKSNKPGKKKPTNVRANSKKGDNKKGNNAKQSKVGKRGAATAKTTKQSKNNKTKASESKGKELVLHDPSKRQVAIPRKRKFIDEDIEIIDTRSCKRMASLNASAILAASSQPERRVFKRSRSIESTRSTGSTVEMIHETKISSSSNSRLRVPPTSDGDSIHACTSNQVVVESAQTIELIKKVRRSSGKIRERLLAIEMMEREFDMVGKGMKDNCSLVENGRKLVKSTEKTVSAKSVKKCHRSIQSTTTREATTGLRRTTEYQVTKVQINTSKATDLSSEKTAHHHRHRHHQIETILNEDAIVQKYHIHHKTKATSQSYRVQMETSSFHPASNSSIINNSNDLLTSTNTIHAVPCLPLHSSSTGPTVGDLHFTNGANILQNSSLLTASSNQGLNHNAAAAAAAAAAACFSYPNQPSIVQVACNQPYRALTSTNSSINQINPIPVLNIGPPQYPPHYASAFSVPHHTNHVASINYPTESYGFYQHSGSIIQPIHDPYIRAYSLHKPIPYHASQMAHHSDQTYREFNPIITIHQTPHHDSQHLSVNIAVNSPTTALITRDPMTTIATSAQPIASNQMNSSHIQSISTSSPSSFTPTNGSTSGPSIAFLGSTSIIPGRLAPSMFEALSTTSPSSSAVNSIINSELPQGLSPVPGPAPVAVATPVSVENLTSLSTASPLTMPNEISPLGSTSISTQVDFSPIVSTNSNHSRSPSTFGSPSTASNHSQSNVATISPLVTSSTNRFNKSVSCSTNTDPESRRSHQHHQSSHNRHQQIHQQQSPSPSPSQSAITITPVVINSSGNYANVNNICNTSSVTSSGTHINTNNNNSITVTNSRQQKAITSTFNNNFLRDASVNTLNSDKDSPIVNMTRKNQRKQFENSNNNNNTNFNNTTTNNNSSNSNINTISKQKSQPSRVRYSQSQISSSSSNSSSSVAVSSPATTNSSPTSNLPSSYNTSTTLQPTGINSSSPPSTSNSAPSNQLVTSSINKKVTSTPNSNHVNGQFPSTKKRPTKSNKNLIDSTLVNEGQTVSGTPSSSTTTISPSIEIGTRKQGKKRLFHGWSWRGNPSKKPVFIMPDEPPQLRDCYPAICHIQGDVIKVRDSVLLRGGPRKTDLHFVAKICALWEAPETGEMMMSLLWYYRPEHTEPGRKPYDQADEIFASKHQDVNSVACIDDKCYVLTFNEYCRYRKRQKMEAENIDTSLTDTLVPVGKDYNRRSRLPRRKVFPDRVFFCRKVYDFRLGRTLKNPVPPSITDSSYWRR